MIRLDLSRTFALSSAGASSCSGSPCSAGSYGAAGTPAAAVDVHHGTPALYHDRIDGTKPARKKFTEYIVTARACTSLHETCIEEEILRLTSSRSSCRTWISNVNKEPGLRVLFHNSVPQVIMGILLYEAGATRSSDALCSLCPPGTFSTATGQTMDAVSYHPSDSKDSTRTA
jgi:hypothetical protein